MLFVSLAQQTNLVDVKALIWIYLEHTNHQASQFLAVPLRRRRKLALGDSLKEFVKV